MKKILNGRPLEIDLSAKYSDLRRELIRAGRNLIKMFEKAHYWIELLYYLKRTGTEMIVAKMHLIDPYADKIGRRIIEATLDTVRWFRNRSGEISSRVHSRIIRFSLATV